MRSDIVYVLTPEDAAKWEGKPVLNEAGERIGMVRNARPVVSSGRFVGIEADIVAEPEAPAQVPTVVEKR